MNLPSTAMKAMVIVDLSSSRNPTVLHTSFWWNSTRNCITHIKRTGFCSIRNEPKKTRLSPSKAIASFGTTGTPMNFTKVCWRRPQMIWANWLSSIPQISIVVHRLPVVSILSSLYFVCSLLHSFICACFQLHRNQQQRSTFRNRDQHQSPDLSKITLSIRSNSSPHCCQTNDGLLAIFQYAAYINATDIPADQCVLLK